MRYIFSVNHDATRYVNEHVYITVFKENMLDIMVTESNALEIDGVMNIH